ncbi:hypothetical protein D3C85_1671180 [compost metagenome]
MRSSSDCSSGAITSCSSGSVRAPRINSWKARKDGSMKYSCSTLRVCNMLAWVGKLPDESVTSVIAASYSNTRISVMCAAAAANTSARDLK